MSAMPGPESKRTELPDGLPKPRRHWAVFTLLMVITITVFDSTMVNVALPTIAESMQVTPSSVVRIVVAYSLVVVVTLLPFSAMAERLGYPKTFVLGIVIFGLASLGAALSTSLSALMAARIVQGLGSSMLMCLFGGLVRNIYPLRKLAMGISINASTVGLAAVLGPSLGAWILAISSWPWIFLVNIPICILALIGVRALPDVPRVSTFFDWKAAALSVPALGLSVLGLDALGEHTLRGLFYLLLGIGFSYILLRYSRKQKAPLVPVDLMRIVTMRYAVGASLTLFAAQMASFVVLPFYMLNVLAYSYTDLGLALGMWSIGTAAMAPVSAYFSERYSIAVLCVIGSGSMGLSLLLMLLVPVSGSFFLVLFIMLLGGVGFGFFQTPNNRALLASGPRNRSGAAGALQAVTRVFGQSVGTAFVAVAFVLSGSWGPQAGLAVAITFTLLAMFINIARIFNPASDPVAP